MYYFEGKKTYNLKERGKKLDIFTNVLYYVLFTT